MARGALAALVSCCLWVSADTLAVPGAVAALVIDALHSTLREGACVEHSLKRALRSGTRSGAVETGECRAAVASAVFGVSTLRARLAGTLARCWCDQPVPRPAEPQLLALWLLHETPLRSEVSALREHLPLDSLGLPQATLERLASPVEARRSGALVPRFASSFSLPCSLVRQWSGQLSEAQLTELASCCNAPGKVWLRCNVAVCSRAATQQALEAAGVRTRRGAHSPWALELLGSRADWGGSVWSLAGWREGAFELQDEGSQLIALACAAQPGEQVLDLCAGNGGKSLALAALLGESGGESGTGKKSGTVFAHDIDGRRLAQLSASAERAGVAARLRLLPPETPLETPLSLSAVDVALVDAPCSSSGVLRRHPGLRWSGRCRLRVAFCAFEACLRLC